MVEPMDRVPWSSTPPDTAAERFYPLVRPSHLQPVYGLIVSKTIVCVPTHWIDNHTIPCANDTAGCDACRAGYGIRWKAYVGAVEPASGKMTIMELTGEAIKNCPRIAGKDKIVRGVQLKLYRRGKYPNAPVVAEVRAEVQPEKVSVPDFDVRPHLLRIWHMVPTKGMSKKHVRLDQAHTEGGPTS